MSEYNRRSTDHPAPLLPRSAYDEPPISHWEPNAVYGWFNGLGDLIWQDANHDWHTTRHVIIPEPLHVPPSGLVPCSGMDTETFNRNQGNAGEMVYNGADGSVTVAIQESEIPIARHTVAPNFAPSDNVLGFTCTRPDGSCPQSPYIGPDGNTLRPALFPSVNAARAALTWPTGQLGSRVYYHSDTIEALNASIASVTTAEPRDTTKDPI